MPGQVNGTFGLPLLRMLRPAPVLRVHRLAGTFGAA
jgi:hypothetical protein